MRVRLKEGSDHPPGWEDWDEFEIFGRINGINSTLILRELPGSTDEFLDCRVASVGYVETVLVDCYETIPDKDTPDGERPRKQPSRIAGT